VNRPLRLRVSHVWAKVFGPNSPETGGPVRGTFLKISIGGLGDHFPLVEFKILEMVTARLPS